MDILYVLVCHKILSDATLKHKGKHMNPPNNFITTMYSTAQLWADSMRYITLLVVNYGISNTIVLEIPEFTTKPVTLFMPTALDIVYGIYYSCL